MRMEILAHRTGGGSSAPNSLQSLEESCAQGAIAAECDITFFGEEPYVYLPEMRSRLRMPGDLHACLSDRALKKTIRRNDCPEHLLHLDDIWNFLATHPNFRMYFDVKYYGWDIRAIEPIPRELICLAMERIVYQAPRKDQIGFTTFLGGQELLRAARSVDRLIGADLILMFPWESIAGSEEYLTSVTIGWKYINHWRVFPGSVKRIVADAKKGGLKTYAGLANSYSHLQWVFRQGFTGIWTDNVAYAQWMLQQGRR